MDSVIRPKNYYYDLSQVKIAEIKASGKRPKLLLHSCCAPCNSYVMIMLSEVFDLTLLYNGSNIVPEAEYLIRSNELKDYTKSVNKQYNLNIQIKEFTYDTQTFHKELAKHDDGREGGQRCRACYKIRMREAYQYALANDFDYFTTVMTISRQKNSIILNEIGNDLNSEYASDKYFFSDFKKKNGILKSNEIIKEYDMYRQEYCGCAFSYQQYLKGKVSNG